LKDAIDSTNAPYIKSKIRPHIERATHCLCIVGKESAKSQWIEWEIITAVANEKKLIGMKIDKACASPAALLKNGAVWALSFTFDSIKKALGSA